MREKGCEKESVFERCVREGVRERRFEGVYECVREGVGECECMRVCICVC